MQSSGARVSRSVSGQNECSKKEYPEGKVLGNF